MYEHKSIPWNPVVLLVFAVVVVSTSHAFEPIFESFDGSGSFSATVGNVVGLDNDGWLFFADGELRDGGYAVHNLNVGEFELDQFGREVTDARDFVARVEIRGTELPPPFMGAQGAGSIEFDYFLDPGNFLHQVSMGLHPEQDLRGADPTVWKLFVFSGASEFHFADVPIGGDIALEIEFDFDGRQSTFTYDWNTQDNDPGITLGPYPYLDPIADLHINRLSLWPESRGIVDYWSLAEPGFGDFDKDGMLSAEDLDLLLAEVRRGGDDVVFDLNNDSIVDSLDISVWIRDLNQSSFGDSNLDGVFNSADLVIVFQAAEYEDGIEANSRWSTGDWNGDAEFDSRDLVLAFQDGGYEVSARAAPEPSFGAFLATASLLLLFHSRRHQNARIDINEVPETHD